MNNMPWWMAWALLIVLALNVVINLWSLAVKWGWV
jgi:hypothetical protein